MANRKSWRRAVAPTPSPRSAPKRTPAFAGVSDSTLQTILTALVAHDVLIRTIDGAEYTGLFYGTSLSSPPSVLRLHIHYARSSTGTFETSAICSDVRGGVARALSVPVAQIAVLRASSPFTALDTNVAPGFATDAQISRGAARPGRALQRFDDFKDLTGKADKPLDDQTFGDLTVNGSAKWDQFQVNQDKFGVTTTFDEDEYTTKIDRADAKYLEREREAARLAEEIEAKTSDNVHMREERNQELGTDFDEETLYSGVIRPDKTKSRPLSSNVRSSSHPAQPPTRSPANTKSLPAKSAAVQTPVKELPKETKRLSYAAAAASSVKSALAVSSAARATSPQQVISSKTGISAAATKTPSGGSAKTVSPRPVTSKGAPSPLASAQGKLTASDKGAVAQKHGGPVRSGTSGRGVASSKSGMSGKGGASGSANAFGKHKQFVSRASGGGLENKGRDLLEKRSKAGGRDRSSREELPQLAKVRSSTLTGRTSPNQSRNSPLPTPAATDTSAVAVLNLDAQTPNIGPEQIKSFEKYKTKREIQSIAQNREKITDDLRKFSTRLDSRNGSLRRANSNSTANGTMADRKVLETTPKNEQKLSPATTPETKLQENKKVEVSASKELVTEVASKPKPKVRIKLNPNAQEFKLNPDAAEFTPTVQEQPPMNHAPQPYNPYGMGPAEYSQPLPSAPQPAYPVPMQAMGQIPYGQAAYGILMPGAVPSGVGAPNSAYQFVPPGSFAPSPQVPGRFPQSGAIPVSYGYGQINPTMPMVMAQAPQRIPSGPYGYYNSGPYLGGQVAGGPQIPPPQAQPQMFVPPHQPGGIAHMPVAGIPMGSRGGHGHPRRGGGGRRGGKHQSHHGVGAGGVGSLDKGGPRVTENGVVAEARQR